MKFALSAILFYIALIGVIVTGWVFNIINLLNYSGTMASAGFHEILQVIGVVVFPLGALMGYVG